ncbi:hypothetical protein EJ07DRAFT_158916 [Lizonia empirigonia]|nr:hypothetical protein EJ07DRAFT_158916 [Lizonia empirigonia]
MSGKINKSGNGRDRTRHPKQSAIEHHDDYYRKLEAERAKLLETEKQGMFTDDDKNRLEEIQKALAGYDRAMAQANTNPITVVSPEADTTMENDAIRQDTARQDLIQQGAIGQDLTEQETTGQNVGGQKATGQPATVSAPGPETTHANPLRNLSKHERIRQEHQEGSRNVTNRLVDDLNMAWDVDVNDKHSEPFLQNHDKEVFGHIARYTQIRYCVRYGSADAYSARFESTLPDGSSYKGTRDVTQRSNRIVERIVLVVYWDSKMGIGHTAEVDVLAPDYRERRPPTRCFIYLDPALYVSRYGIENKSGYSHETRSTMKLLMEGHDDWQKSITFYNIAVRLENRFEEKCLRGISGRPGPLRELAHEKKAASRRSRSRYTTVESAVSPTLMRPPTSPRHFKLLPEIQTEQTPVKTESGNSLKDQFHADFLELFDLAEDTTYADLTEQQQLLYPAQFKKWKAANA